jgi:hypothetical protein
VSKKKNAYLGTVWIAIHYVAYEGSTLIGVYADVALAQKHALAKRNIMRQVADWEPAPKHPLTWHSQSANDESIVISEHRVLS